MPDLYLRIDSQSVDGIWPIGQLPLAAPPAAIQHGLLKLLSFKHRVHSPISITRPSAFEAQIRRAYCEHCPVVVERVMDNASPSFFKACAAGTVFPAVQMFSCDSMNDDGNVAPSPFMRVQLSNVVVTDYHYRSTPAETPRETMQLHYTSINVRFKAYDYANEAWGANEDVSWNGTTNTAAADQVFNAAAATQDNLFP